MFDPRDPYERHMWHYESNRPLSVAQLIALGSLDAPTAALLWLLIERHTSFIISGPTDPMPGVGKTTTMNAMLDFLPDQAVLVYTSGMFERFDFTQVTDPAATCVLCNEVSDHLRIYMWGRVARRFLNLPADGYAIATSMHADTLDDVLSALMDDLHLPAEMVSHLGVIVNIGLVGSVWPPRRRWLTVHLLQSGSTTTPVAGDQPIARPADTGTREVCALQLSRWLPESDTFAAPTAEALAGVASALQLNMDQLSAALKRRTDCLQELAAGRGANLRAVRQAILQVQKAEQSKQSSNTRPDDKASGQHL